MDYCFSILQKVISIVVELILIPFYWIAVRFIIPHLAEKTKKEVKSKNLEKISV